MTPTTISSHLARPIREASFCPLQMGVQFWPPISPLRGQNSTPDHKQDVSSASPAIHAGGETAYALPCRLDHWVGTGQCATCGTLHCQRLLFPPLR